jgi:hypothetical protein
VHLNRSTGKDCNMSLQGQPIKGSPGAVLSVAICMHPANGSSKLMKALALDKNFSKEDGLSHSSWSSSRPPAAGHLRPARPNRREADVCFHLLTDGLYPAPLEQAVDPKTTPQHERVRAPIGSPEGAEVAQPWQSMSLAGAAPFDINVVLVVSA